MSTFEQEHEEWIKATCFTKLLKLNAMYLRGESQSTPYVCGPVDEDIRNLIPQLLELHQRHIFTYGCNPYLHRFGRKISGDYEDCKMRPSLGFIVAEEDMPLKLFQELKKDKTIKVRAQKIYSSDPMVRGSFTGKTVFGKYRSSRFKITLSSKRWKVSEAFMDNMAQYSDEDIFQLEAMKQAKPWAFDVVAASWKDINIPEIVINAVKMVKAR